MESVKPLILIVDDNITNSTFCEKLLVKNGYETSVCSSGEEALEFISKNTPDLILLDIVMPGIDGFQFCDQLKRTPRLKDTPIIFLSAMNDETSIINGFKCGGVDFITRPFRAQELIARTRTHIELKKAKEKLLTMAVTDELTGLFNRRYFMSRLNQEFERVKRYESIFTFIMIDIDYFKKINDTHGHLAGDCVLRNAADIMKKSLRISDTVGRIGGEEFAILLPETEIEYGVEIAERLRKKIDESEMEFECKTLKLTISAGISDSDTNDLTVDSVLNRADVALYEVKENGRNRVMAIRAEHREKSGR
ncbi:MAG TPA: diguanylate cyclase [Spirochaetota bacterium]|nr:diguanylate cyclase [Spirochaetota bacterium]